VEDHQSRVVEFTRVLHVPELCSNLLSVLYLTQHKAIQVIISCGLMSFVKDNALLFTVSVSDSNSALLDCQTVSEEHQAQPASTCALDLTLWHRRLGHVNMDYIQRVAKENSILALGLTLMCCLTPFVNLVSLASNTGHLYPTQLSTEPLRHWI
jgi:hypothetical protein